MSARPVDVFFYGSYMNFAVLAEVAIGERPYSKARLPGFRLVIAPRANLLVDPSAEAFGIVTALTHAELELLYSEHAQRKLGETYLPEAVLVEIEGDGSRPALCYLCHDMQPADADPAYVERILVPSTGYGFPDAYLEHIGSFK